MVIPERNLTVDWRPFSLAIKNNELQPHEDESPHAVNHRRAHRVLRVIEAAAAAGASRAKLYTDFGKMVHVDGGEYDDMAIDIALGINSLPAELAQAADDTQYDAALSASNDAALKLVGNDVGVPIIIIEQTDGSEAGYFGPVLQSLPDEATGLKLWDGLVQLATVPEFYELKRTRPGGMPDTGSTKTQVSPAVC